MTAHKHFKQLVRSRMSKTGESYTTARRQVLRQAATPADRGPAFWHLPGSIPAPTALRILLTAAGVRDPRTGEPISEAMLFGIAGGIGIGVAAFRYEQADFSSFYVAGRHCWQDELAYLKGGLSRFGIKPAVFESAGAKAAESRLREALEGGKPCIAWVDMTHLPHRGMPQEFSGGGYHLITVYRIDDTHRTALIGDLTDQPLEISLADLAKARARIKSFKNRLLSIEPARSPQDLAPLIRAGLAACHAGLVGKPAKGAAGMSTLPALKRWAERLRGSSDMESWERLFPRGHLLWQGLIFLHDFVENYQTGGGLCRPMFAEFLGEAAELEGLANLGSLADRYTRLGKDWTDLAAIALPQEYPAFREASDLCERRAELMAAGDPANADAIRAIWKRLRELKDQARTEFPLSEAQTAALRATLQAKVEALHQAEVDAHGALGQSLP